MAIGREIKVVLTLDNNGFRMGIRDANGDLRNFAQQITATANSVRRTEGALTGWGASLQRATMTMGMARFALMDLRDIFLSLPLAVLKTAGEIERVTKLMEGLSTETDAAKRKLEAAAGVKFVLGLAQNAPFEVKAITDSFVKLKVGGLDPTNGSLRSLLDGVAKFGGSSEQLKRASIAIQQMSGKGVISMEELRQQLGEAIPTAMRSMAEGMNMSMAELTKAVSKGTVTAGSAIQKMLIVMGISNAGAAAEMMDTWTGMLERLKTKWELFKLDMASEGLFDTSKAALKELIDSFNGVDSGTLARSIGRTMNDIALNIIGATKWIVSMGEAIKTVGTAMLVYWGATKVAPMLAGMVDGFKRMQAQMLLNRDFVMANAENEQRMRNATHAAEITRLRQHIANNQAAILADRTLAQERYALQAAEVQSRMATDTAILGTQRARITAMMEAEQAYRTSVAVQATRIPGMATDAHRAEAEALRQKMLATRMAGQQALSYAGQLETQIAALRAEALALRTSSAATTDRQRALMAMNATLAASVVQQQAQTRAIIASNSAMSLMQGAAMGVVGFLKNMIFSMSGVVIAIMAAVYAWDYFSSKAKQAASDAERALNLRDRIERGTVSKEDTEASQRQITKKENQNSMTQFLIKEYETDEDLKANDKDGKKVAALREQNRKELAAIADMKATQRSAEKDVLDKDAALRAGDLEAVVNEEVNRSLKTMFAARNKFANEMSKSTLTKPEYDKKSKLLEGMDVEILEAQRDALSGQANKYRELAQKAGVTDVARKSYEVIIERIEKDRAAKSIEITGRQAANRFNSAPKDPKDKNPKTEPTDALLNKIDADAKAILRAKGRMTTLSGDLVDLAQLRAQAEEEIAQIVEQDRRVKKVAKASDIEKAIDQLTNRKVIEAALQEQQAIFPRLEANKEKLRQLTQRFESGDERGAPKDEEAGILVMLEKISKTSLAAEEALRPVLKARRELLDTARGIDVFEGIAENTKRIRDLEVGTVMSARERIKAEGAKEVQDLNCKYDQLLAKTEIYSEAAKRLGEQRTEELKLQAAKQAKALETPLAKLAREWENTQEVMENAQAKWADGFLNMLTSSLRSGRLEMKEFIASILIDIAAARMKAQLSPLLDKTIGKAADWVGGMIGMGGPKGGAAGGESGVAAPAGIAAAGKALYDVAAKAGIFGDAVKNAAKDGVAKLATSAVQSVVATTTEVTATEAATISLMSVAYSAEMAAASLMQAAAAAAGQEAANMFAFADGGIMTNSGPLPLRKYANGGIANSPQVALYGEAGPEAYVPLPDGRTIPVTMSGGGGGSTQTVNIGITINEADGSSKSSSDGDSAGTWRQMAERVKEVVQQEIVGQQRPGGLLYK